MYEIHSDKKGFLLPLLLSFAVVAIAIWAKLSLTTGALLPGIDGAYYWVQARAIIENLRLAFDDLPLVFIGQAGLSLLVGDIKLGVRISDALFPALSAIPIFFMLRHSKAFWVPALAIAAVLLNPIQLYFFTGNFIKNAAAIPLVFVIGLILMKWDTVSHKKSTVWLLITLGLLALSHFGVMLMSVLVVGLWLLFQMRRMSKKVWLIGSTAAVGSAALILGALALFVPDRFNRLIELISDPASLFANPSWQEIFGFRAEPAIAFAVISGQIGAIVFGIVAWFIRHKLSFSDRSLVASTLVAAFLLSSPFIANEWSQRLSALAFVPLSIAAIVLFARAERLLPKLVFGVAALVPLSVALISSSSNMARPVMTDAQYQEFQQMANDVQLDSNSVVVASHGLEFLVAWEMKTDVIQDQFYQDADTSKYASVYYLQQTGGGFGGGHGGFTASSYNGEFPGGTPPTRPDKGTFGDGDRPAPPLGATDSNFQPPGDGTHFDQGAGFGPGFAVSLTGDNVYESDSFTLVKVS